MEPVSRDLGDGKTSDHPFLSGLVFRHSVIAVQSNPSSHFRRDGFHGISPDSFSVNSLTTTSCCPAGQK
jgi:hypothetical protein